MKNLKFLLFLSFFTFTLVTTQSCKDPCKDVVCQNGGECEDGGCLCADGFTGTNCENNSNSFSVSDSTYFLSSGFLEDFGDNGNGSFDFDVTLTSPGIVFTGGDITGAGEVVYLDLNSNSAEGLVDGIYTFVDDYERDAFDLTAGGYSIGYDVATGNGEIFDIIGGTVEIKVDGENYTFDFDLESSNGIMVGNYSGTLNK